MFKYKNTLSYYIMMNLCLEYIGKELLKMYPTITKSKIEKLTKLRNNHGKCHNLSFGLMIKAKGLQGCGARGSSGITSHTPKMWGSEPSHSQGNSHFGRWSLGGLPKLQRAISRVKTQYLVTFFISLKSSCNVDV
jgi:hypothetical protein